MTRGAKIGITAVALVLPLFYARACGPDFGADVFIRPLRPDDAARYLSGKLGVLQPSYPRSDLIYAYRYLVGGTVSTEEKLAYAPTIDWLETDREYQRESAEQSNAPEAVATVTPEGRWLQARAGYPSAPRDVAVDRQFSVKSGNFQYQETYSNCYPDAFRVATETLAARSTTWGPASEWTLDWVKGQDAVFANCGKGVTIPVAPPVGAPALLQSDRAYQVAAALFYAEDYSKAQAAFEQIAQDRSSPWQPWGKYLATRSLIREAFNAPDAGGWKDQQTFDSLLLRKAQQEIQSALADPAQGPASATIAQALQDELEFVEMRTEPEMRAAQLGAALTGPKPDPKFAQHLIDLTWLMNARAEGTGIRSAPAIGSFTILRPYNQESEKTLDQLDAAFQAQRGFRDAVPLVDWLFTFQSGSRAAKAHALQRWKKTRDIPWLVNAISHADGDEPEAAALLAESAKVELSSPAGVTVAYHRARLLQARGDWKGAAELLATVAPIAAESGLSAQNAIIQLQMENADSLPEFLKYAPKHLQSKESQAYSNWESWHDLIKTQHRGNDCTANLDTRQFDGAAAAVLNTKLPIATLAQAAASNELPPQLKQALVLMGWTRAVMLQDASAEAALRPLLPARLISQLGDGSRYAQQLVLARNPGLGPYLRDGIQRNYAYDFVDDYRDNWSCTDTDAPIGGTPPRFLTPQQRAAANAEFAALQITANAPDSTNTLGRELVNYVRTHPDAPHGDEAMFLVLRMFRYSNDCWGTPEPERKNIDADRQLIRADAARILRQRYAASHWTKKAAPFVG